MDVEAPFALMGDPDAAAVAAPASLAAIPALPLPAAPPAMEAAEVEDPDADRYSDDDASHCTAPEEADAADVAVALLSDAELLAADSAEGDNALKHIYFCFLLFDLFCVKTCRRRHACRCRAGSSEAGGR